MGLVTAKTARPRYDSYMASLLVFLILIFSFLSYFLFNLKNDRWKEFSTFSTREKIFNVIFHLIFGYILFSFFAAALPPSVLGF